MRLTSLRLHWVQVPFHEPFRISNGEVSVKDAILVELEAFGSVGWGEASPMAGAFYSRETPESTWDFLRTRLIPAFLERPDIDRRGYYDRVAEFPGEPFAKAGFEGAVWDLWSRERGKPLYSELRGTRRPIESGAAIGLMPSVEALVERVEKFLSQGYRRIKIKIEPGRDLELVRAIRQRFRETPLMVDANGAYGPEHFPIFQELDRLGLMMIEQPLARDALEEHAELQRRLRTPICLDESAESPEAIETIVRLGSARILNIKVQRMGGLVPARQAHDAARAVGMPCWLGTMPELGVASVQALHLATLPSFTYPTDVEASSRWFVDDIISPSIEVARDGLIHLPEGPGTGYRVDVEKVAKYQIRFEEFHP
ncbi:MAG: o-succinylbenzoate synthase [Acidobacteria bacterium]|nr:o-succinylbenzoate synthase [Acidobacteriota bacterium]